uniref:Uncharacterized protein n=1 Tax=Siphoviridae sp. ctZd434 TaxID=2825559 RepID=A0A8S5UHJ5_9CAUD|nr:MAG TPA: hypothetical protein [Siphoviridae sp. ctZd434]
MRLTSGGITNKKRYFIEWKNLSANFCVVVLCRVIPLFLCEFFHH